MDAMKARNLRDLLTRAAAALEADDYNLNLIDELKEAADDMFEEMVACEGQSNIRRV